MTYNSKKTIANMFVGIIISIAYAIHALGNNAPNDLKSWSLTMLSFIGIGVVAIIIIQILFHIAMAIGIAVKEQQEDSKEIERIIAATMVEDEREKIINLKSANIGYIFAGIGFITMLVVLAFDASSIMGLNIMFAMYWVGSFIEGGVSVYLNERGF
jgi:hypothetical protein